MQLTSARGAGGGGVEGGAQAGSAGECGVAARAVHEVVARAVGEVQWRCRRAQTSEYDILQVLTPRSAIDAFTVK